ncbi:hypothetical protein B0I35DRAFT_479113 [Stachybotrys elegans]|uniref:Uncharacterized protein n=1 Tax=Stachybotrys elegans TaxID=80388 RepID=A0A8K0WSL1_9HYPO|nr:hypothetical protein B0I35DRAFT_479113 [Stachybotrys elegans]
MPRRARKSRGTKISLAPNKKQKREARSSDDDDDDAHHTIAKNDDSSDDECAEWPTEDDFTRRYGNLSRCNYEWGPPPVRIDVASTERMAPKPHVPFKNVPSWETSDSQEKKQKAIARLRESARQDSEDDREPLTLSSISVEMRLEIFRHLLVQDNQIMVRSNWTRVLKWNKLQLDPRILRTCKTFYAEGLALLYGENVFHYKIRDPIARVIDVSDLPSQQIESDADSDAGSEVTARDGIEPEFELDVMELDANHEMDPEEEGDDEYVENTDDGKQELTIPFDEYIHLFRQVIVEAESNRYNTKDMNHMARIISRLCPPSRGRHPGERVVNIHTLTIRVYPNRRIRPYADPDWTFRTFFEPESPVIQNILKVQCQFLRLEILKEHIPTGARRQKTKSNGKRFVADTRSYRNLQRTKGGLPDFWASDPTMQLTRRVKAARTRGVITSLAERYCEACRVVVAARQTNYAPDDVPEWLLDALQNSIVAEDF